MSGIGSMVMTNQTAQMYAQILANMTEMSKQNAEAMKKYSQARQEARKAEYKQQLEALEKQEAAEKENFVQQATKKQTVAVAEDGKDDGKISFRSKVKNVGKGALKTVKGMFCDENGFSFKRTLTTIGVAAAGAALIAVTGGAAAPFLVGAGAVLGGANIAKGAIKAAGAQTDAQAEAAWQEIGGGALEVGLSMTGAKAASGKTFTGNKFMQSLKATWDCVRTTGKGVWKAIRHPQKTYTQASEFLKTEGKANWEAAFKSNKAQDNKIAQIDKKYAKEIEGYQKQQQKLLDELTELKKDSTKNAKKIAKKEAEYKAIEEKIETAESARELNKTDYAETVDGYKEMNKDIYKQLMDEYTDLSTKGTLSPKETARLEQVEALIKRTYQRNSYLDGSNNASFARNLTIKGIKAEVEASKARIAELKAKKSLTDAEKTELKGLKQDVKQAESLIKDMETVRDIEIKNLQAQNAKTRIEQLKTKKEQVAREIEAKQAEIKAESDLTKKIELNKELKAIQEKEAKIDRLISDNESIISTTKRAHHFDNAVSFAKTTVKPQGVQLANTTAATNGFLFGTNVIPKTQEITVKAENYDTMAQQLEQYQAARRKQLETAFTQQSMFNPMNLLSGINTGMNPLSFLPPLTPEII